MASKPTQYFPFLDLPPEIRKRIYIILCTAPPTLNNDEDDSDHDEDLPTYYTHTSFPHSLLLTSSLIYEEIRPIYFTHNSFRVKVDRHNDTLQTFLSRTFRDNRLSIKTLHVELLRLGPKTFFVKELAPVLEDCILNGKLRNLNILLSESFAQRIAEKVDGQQKGEDYDTWRVLKRILSDPYLKQVDIDVAAKLSEGRNAVVCFRDEGRRAALLRTVGFERSDEDLARTGNAVSEVCVSLNLRNRYF